MALTPEEVRKISSLARLRFTPEQETVLTGQLGRIVDYFDQLRSFEGDFEGEDGSAMTSAPAVLEAEDVTRPCLPRDLFLANAPASALGEFLAVPEVKGGGNE
jgi:aspartyl-tRNA(Asn)/glutamyl-tRNA(Gln) amidotransferase subunit C